MKTTPYYFIGIYLLLIIVSGCGTPKLVTYRENAQSAETAGNYAEATDAWQAYFNEFETTGDIDGVVFAKAASAAYQAGEFDQAEEWYDQARFKDFSSPEMYLNLAEIYSKQDNLSKELSALEYYNETFENVPPELYNRLFSLYTEINRTEDALAVWNKLPQEVKSSEPFLEKYLSINKELENETVADFVSRELLEINPKNVAAMEWIAKETYEQAENLYQREMNKYKNNRTTRQYRILLEELDKVTTGFKTALGYFEKLWEINPDDRKDYAVYLANIYIRFEEEDKASYYRNMVEN